MKAVHSTISYFCARLSLSFPNGIIYIISGVPRLRCRSHKSEGKYVFGGRNYLSFLPPGSDNNRFTRRGVMLNKLRAPLRRNYSKEEENEGERDRQIRLISVVRRWTTVVTII